MSYNPEIHNRRSIRLKGYDYSQSGLYFITICTENKKHLFGKIDNGKMILNDAGKLIDVEWLKSEKIRNEIKLHEYIIMPNHFHGIVEIAGANGNIGKNGNVGANGRSPVQNQSPVHHGFSLQSKSIGSLMAGFKSSVAVKINKMCSGERLFARTVWQRNYWEHIVRNENEYHRISEYIKNNPLNWELDKLNGGKGNIVMENTAPYNEENWMV
jgi:putative transposase